MSSGSAARAGTGDTVTTPLGSPPVDHQARLSDPRRLAALTATGLLDEEADAAFDRFTLLAARLLKAPTALISLVDDHRQFFKSALGLSEPWSSKRETPLEYSFCQYAVTSAAPLVVEDARQHPFLKGSQGTSELDVVAYAGVPLVDGNEQVLGALCVIDTEPRAWTAQELEILRDLAELTMTEIRLRAQLTTVQALRDERAQERLLLHAIIDSIDDAIVVARKDGQILHANPAARAQGLEWDRLEALTLRRAIAGEHVRDALLVLESGQGERRHFSVNCSPLVDGAGNAFAVVSVARDVTQARLQQQALSRSEAMLKSVVHNLPRGAVLCFDHELRYQLADGEELLSGIGFGPDDLIGRSLADIATPERLPSIEKLYRAALAGQTNSFEATRNGKTYAVTTSPVRDVEGAVTGGLVMVYDVTTLKQAEALVRREADEMHTRSLSDELTGLYNRRGFLEVAEQRLAQAARAGHPALLFFVDLDGMKQINDHLGHEQGDRALIETAEVLRSTFRGTDVLARLGGDEFVALLVDGDASQLAQFEGRVKREIDLRNSLPGRAFTLSASIGCATFDPAAPEPVEALLAKADMQMYAHKKAHKDALRAS
jgi:diguanylate cyclase (GGDEF)-like protein/PAS domain S-box-containing protein